MKPKTIEEIIFDICDDKHYGRCEIDFHLTYDEAKQQLIEIFMSCVPDEKSNGSNPMVKLAMGGWNGCRDQMIKNLEKLK